MGRSRFEARYRPTRRSLRRGRAPGRGLSSVREGSRASGCSGAAGATRSPRAPLAIRGPGAAFYAARRPASGCTFGSRSPLGPALALGGARAAFSAARRPASGYTFGSRSPLGSDLADTFGCAGGRARTPSIGTFCSARRTTITRGTSIPAARAVQQIAAVAAARFREKDGRHCRNRLGGAQQLDPTRRRRLLLRR